MFHVQSVICLYVLVARLHGLFKEFYRNENKLNIREILMKKENSPDIGGGEVNGQTRRILHHLGKKLEFLWQGRGSKRSTQRKI